MVTPILKVGVSAVFDPAVTPHARTFLRALATARNHHPALAKVSFLYADDGACPLRAQEVAREFIAAGADLVVGHFSSDAALAVAGLYTDADVPLLTPAATADAITLNNGSVFRLCPTDQRLAGHLVALAAGKGWRRLEVRADDSAHGQAIAAAVRAALDDRAVTGAQADAVVFAGRLAASAAFLDDCAARGDRRPILLTDDAVSPYLRLPAGLTQPVLAVGFRSAASYSEAALARQQYRLLFRDEPETYFLEGYAAFQIVAALVSPDPCRSLRERLAADGFATAMGEVRFVNGEVPSLSHAAWRLGPDGFAETGGDAADPLAAPIPRRSATA